jgi:hypothetical protein
MFPLTVQSFMSAPFRPSVSVPPLIPIPVEYCNCIDRLCRASKLESARSAASGSLLRRAGTKV